ncbi:serpin peptidase inhibitor, clade F (alpha-2 antiplasmin, pigment epithelium derived factor), member 2b [Gadus macrocephalus]|uniref:serpin peptidase inhibitor, clade F (alpha-2 antiplasmin, pigment epithelium derived factor), member 2b n=1 Tax=Gadus macrocephalus TaxID=80720 RepID=UPI0028CB9695|nr:serpin peptidase inhibitor, clade F (alpha-2 antiplasmin, pigment epithelium derived factor), member 2b [Gadus macrocephalus]
MDILLALLLLCLGSKGISNAEVAEVMPLGPLLPSDPLQNEMGPSAMPLIPLIRSKPVETTAENTTEAQPDRTLETTAEGTTALSSASTDTDDEKETVSEEDLDGSCESVGKSRRSLGLIARALQKSGLKLLAKLEPTEAEPNVIISPLSISLALSQLALGAVNETERLLMNYLHGNNLSCYHETLHKALEQLKSDDLQIATRIFLAQGLELKQKFTEDSQRLYGSKPVALEGLQQVNSWVEQATKGKIPEFLTSLPPQLLLMLINAVHFKGEWIARFDPQLTSKGVFYLNDNQLVDVEMMEGPKHPMSVYVDPILEAHVARLRFQKRTSLILVLPTSGQVNVSRLAETLILSEVYSRLPQEQDVKVTLPKLKLEYGQELKKAFTNLDLGLIFSNPDLSGIAEGSLIVTSVKHKSSMELNEEGAEATAATAVIISRMSTPIFSVDRPFFFSLVDDKTKVPIMMGVVNNPNPGAPTMRRPEPGNKDKEGYPVDKSEVSSKGLPPK